MLSQPILGSAQKHAGHTGAVQSSDQGVPASFVLPREGDVTNRRAQLDVAMVTDLIGTLHHGGALTDREV